MQGQLFQAKLAQQQLYNEMGERELRKSAQRQFRPRGPGF